MKKVNIYISIFLLLGSLGCKKSPSAPKLAWDGNLVSFAPVPVSKTSTKKVFVHYMPWFETPITNGGAWGQHWTMSNQVPPAHIASYYYPLNTLYFSNGSYQSAPYATSDTNVVDYQLLLMKLSGIDGVFIDWPGTINYSDYQKNVANTNVVISRLARVGLKYAIVYEDQNLQNGPNGNTSQIIGQAQADMNYVQTNYFTDPSYEFYNGKPALLDFGPFGPLNTSAEWDSVFTVFSNHPAFFPYEYQTGKAGADAVGEFAWPQQSDSNNLSNITNFYHNGYTGEKIAVAFPGFNSFYKAGGEPNPILWTIPYNMQGTTTFSNSLALALQQPGNYIQIVTWNDYGEGTIIEPTTQYQYSYLTTLQQQLGVQSLSQSDLEAVAKLYTQRAKNILPTYNPDKLSELDQVFYYMASLKMDSAKALLNNF